MRRKSGRTVEKGGEQGGKWESMKKMRRAGEKEGEEGEKWESRRKRREVKVWHQSTLNWGANKLRPRPRGRAEEWK